MVEGPTAKAYALKIEKVFKDEVVNEVFVRSKRVFIPQDEVLGRKLKRVETFGKNIVLIFNDIAIRLHLLMFGSIHIYDLNENLLKPWQRVRLLMKGEDKKLAVYNAPIVEIDRTEKIFKKLKNQLGPDPLREEWNREEAVKRIEAYKEQKIGVVMLNQSVIAGVGNILRNEILFRAKINPERLVKNLKKEEIESIVENAEKLSVKFLKFKLEKRRLKPILMVYNRYRKPCMICGSPIKFYMQEPIKRKTFVCEKCQK